MFEWLFEKGMFGSIAGDVVDDSKDFTISVSIPPPPEEGSGKIVSVTAPSSFTPGDTVTIEIRALNNGGTDDMFINIKDMDTGQSLGRFTCAGNPGGGASFCSYPWKASIKLSMSTDFHGRVEVGHIA